jgi:hypothetical protein
MGPSYTTCWEAAALLGQHPGREAVANGQVG